MFSDQAFSFWNSLDRISLIVLLSPGESQFGRIPDTFQLIPKLIISLQSNNNSLFIFAPIIELGESSVWSCFSNFSAIPSNFKSNLWGLSAASLSRIYTYILQKYKVHWIKKLSLRVKDSVAVRTYLQRKQSLISSVLQLRAASWYIWKLSILENALPLLLLALLLLLHLKSQASFKTLRYSATKTNPDFTSLISSQIFSYFGVQSFLDQMIK